jgi:aminopeptidase N
MIIVQVFRFPVTTSLSKDLPGHFPEKHNRLEIKYQSTGPHEPYFVGWKDPTGRMRRQIWAHRPSGWIPFQNDRITVDLHITFNSDYQVYSNGVRVKVQENPDHTRTWHYRMNKPHPFFSTALVIGKYDYKDMTTSSGVPLEYWYYPDQEDHFEPTYRFSLEMFEFLEKELGVPYPWELVQAGACCRLPLWGHGNHHSHNFRRLYAD